METRTRIKICGITNLEDTRAAIDYGADALGFNFVPESPRFIGRLELPIEIARILPPFIVPVAICVDMGDTALFRGTVIKTVQYYQHGPEWSEVGWDLITGTKRLIHAFRILDAESLDAIPDAIAPHRPHALLLDTYHKDKLGGSGETFNWELAVEAKARFDLPIILAGGLTPDNVAEAVAKVRPYAVDVSSGVEAEPGRKDHAKLRAFIRAVQQADYQT